MKFYPTMQNFEYHGGDPIDVLWTTKTQIGSRSYDPLLTQLEIFCEKKIYILHYLNTNPSLTQEW